MARSTLTSTNLSEKFRDDLDFERAAARDLPDVRDPRARGWPCMARHRVKLWGKNSSACYSCCEKCGIRLDYIPTRGSPQTERSAGPAPRDVETALLEMQSSGVTPTHMTVKSAIEEVVGRARREPSTPTPTTAGSRAPPAKRSAARRGGARPKPPARSPSPEKQSTEETTNDDESKPEKQSTEVETTNDDEQSTEVETTNEQHHEKPDRAAERATLWAQMASSITRKHEARERIFRRLMPGECILS